MSAERWKPADDLASLRWDVDKLVTNRDGERVWLGPHFDANGRRDGITDCCLEEAPCQHHAKIAKEQR